MLLLFFTNTSTNTSFFRITDIFLKTDDPTEAARRGVLQKMVLLRVSQNSQENTCARVSFFNKVKHLRPSTLLKKKLRHRCFPVNFCEIFKNTFLQNTSGWLLLVLELVYSNENIACRWTLNYVSLWIKCFLFKINICSRW